MLDLSRAPASVPIRAVGVAKATIVQRSFPCSSRLSARRLRRIVYGDIHLEEVRYASSGRRYRCRTGRLFQDRPQLGSSALCSAVGKVEDWYDKVSIAVFRQSKLVAEMIRTLLNTVLLGAALDALDALLEVVLGRCALLGVFALC